MKAAVSAAMAAAAATIEESLEEYNAARSQANQENLEDFQKNSEAVHVPPDAKSPSLLAALMFEYGRQGREEMPETPVQNGRKRQGEDAHPCINPKRQVTDTRLKHEDNHRRQVFESGGIGNGGQGLQPISASQSMVDASKTPALYQPPTKPLFLESAGPAMATPVRQSFATYGLKESTTSQLPPSSNFGPAGIPAKTETDAVSEYLAPTAQAPRAELHEPSSSSPKPKPLTPAQCFKHGLKYLNQYVDLSNHPRSDEIKHLEAETAILRRRLEQSEAAQEDLRKQFTNQQEDLRKQLQAQSDEIQALKAAAATTQQLRGASDTLRQILERSEAKFTRWNSTLEQELKSLRETQRGDTVSLNKQLDLVWEYARKAGRLQEALEELGDLKVSDVLRTVVREKACACTRTEVEVQSRAGAMPSDEARRNGLASTGTTGLEALDVSDE
ncbi:uncharacterized protein DSM5745_00799 [Aspergillus mulundensis]|uniref:Uncharacterized protein n=1 Tax=Aspergillus mulundensis TaxID=1810919 RepID=A0A3D8T4I1_9EURO|nr:hypothetical protein DSM5745_00799 [Aspergillus mulundensis]RDW93477.1 hypothetical protein DSM5745_00799 [Aspergillus mulundensis]